jgi:fimbrial chaperone protein
MGRSLLFIAFMSGVAAAVWLLLGVALAHAGAIGVSPLNLEITPEHPTRALEITNPSPEPVHVQLRVFAWTGADAQEQYAPNTAVLFSPPMFELEPGGRQVVRLTTREMGAGEAAYRVIVDQIATQAESGVTMPVRLALPLFVRLDGLARGALSWRVRRAPEGLWLVAENVGARHVRLTDLSVETGEGMKPLSRGLAGYVLAGQSRRWRLPDGVGVPRAVQATTDEGALRAALGPE